MTHSITISQRVVLFVQSFMQFLKQYSSSLFLLVKNYRKRRKM